MKVAKLILFLVLIAIFLYFFYIMVVSFYTAINVVMPDVCNASAGFCEVYYRARRGAIAIFNLTAILLFIAFIASITIFFIEIRCYGNECYRGAYRG